MPVPDIQIQSRSKWCWAACTVYVCQLYQTHSGLSQGTLVSRILRRPVCQTNFPDPSCNIMLDLGVSFNFVGHLHGAPIDDRLAPQEILHIFSRGREPIGCQVRFPEFGHAVVIADARVNSAGVLFLAIADPGAGSIHTVTYGEFCSDYLRRGGRWIRTYLTKQFIRPNNI
jgi:hypothetical protein